VAVRAGYYRVQETAPPAELFRGPVGKQAPPEKTLRVNYAIENRSRASRIRTAGVREAASNQA